MAERTARARGVDRAAAQSEQRRSLALAAGQMGSWDWDRRGRSHGSGTRASTASSASSRRAFAIDARERPQRSSIRTTGSRSQPDRSAAWPRANATHADRIPRACARTARCAGASARRRRASTPPATSCADQRRHGRHHRAQGGRGAPGAAGARGRSSRQERARRRAVDRAADARQERRRATSRRSRAASRRLARAHTLLSESRWQGADLGTLVGEELAPYRSGDKVELEGPNVSLQPATAQSSRSRCTSSPPTPPSTARCRRSRARSA